MRAITSVIVLAYLSLEVGGQENIEYRIDAKFELNKTDVISKNQTVASSDTPACECVPYYLCQKTEILGGTGLIDIVVQDDCPSYLDVCCNLSDKLGTPILPTPISNEGCGYRNPHGVGFRIASYDDDKANYGEFPWMVAILAEEFNANTDSILDVYKCGGALIHPQAVLTAAHCVASAEKKYKIRAGEWDTQTTKELVPHQDRNVKTVVIHDKYYASALFNDIAILFLDSPLRITITVNTLCLPEQDFIVPAGTRCFTNGWGKDSYGKGGTYQVILNKEELPIVDRNICEDQLKKTRLGSHFQLDKSFICAGGEPEKDLCKGDGGSPLACPIPGQKDRYQHIGIVAWGIGCGIAQVPGVYVNVPLFREWIDEQITNRKLNTSSYQY